MNPLFLIIPFVVLLVMFVVAMIPPRKNENSPPTNDFGWRGDLCFFAFVGIDALFLALLFKAAFG